MSVVLPLLGDEIRSIDTSFLSALSRIGPLIIPASKYYSHVDLIPDQSGVRCYVLLDSSVPFNFDEVVAFLDRGVEKVIIPLSWANDLISIIPSDRLILLLDIAGATAVSDKVRNAVSGVLIKTPTALDLDLLSSVGRFFSNGSIYVFSSDPSQPLPSQSTLRALSAARAGLILPSTRLTVGPSDDTHINIADAFIAPLVSDRKDGLFPTIVSDATQNGRSLGLVYSSAQSVKESILTGKGVYQSRKHGLWLKGETSGATQDIVSIHIDCDSDALEFGVVQHGAGFCHLNRPSCFGGSSSPKGLVALEKTLQLRLASAPEGSYTKRLFDDSALLQAKIMEEADELCRAQSKDEVAFEAADLLYFALTRCVAAGVGLADIEKSLDRKAKKITRRPGNAKPQWAASASASASSSTSTVVPTKQPPPTVVDADAPIRMHTYDLSQISSSKREELLKRPAINSADMMLKVQPIIDAVRTGGDRALLDFTAKFDRVTLSSLVLLPPFSPSSMQLTDDVKTAIDTAYSNIRAFHAAQLGSGKPLCVETMPGVVCTRFARPIERVGLYVPGGTAILPSTALMLGVPAQVAGCTEITIATPPRADGTVSPEVLYVAHLVGATSVLLAGGAQAIAALAFGTESVGKVDKIFGPGNMWVTAAKMVVAGTMDAQVAIDMPAGPSEVLVIADDGADPAFVAADLLSQAEHGPDSQVVLVALDMSAEKLKEVEREVEAQARRLTRVDIVRNSIPKSIIVRARTVEEAMAFSNDYAPEHLILHVNEAEKLLDSVQNAGSVFVGPYSPERYVQQPLLLLSCTNALAPTAAATTPLVRTIPYQQMDTLVNLVASIRSPSRSTLPRSTSPQMVSGISGLLSPRLLTARDSMPMLTLCASV